MNPSPPRVGIAAITENMLKRKWSAIILRYLEKGINDPAEITKREANLSSMVMNERLRTMLRYGLIARFPRPAPSNVIEYRLTPLGKKILEMINAIDELDQQIGRQLLKKSEDNLAMGANPFPEASL